MLGALGRVTRVITILGVDVDAGLVDRWRSWYCPSQQPFDASRLSAEQLAHVPEGHSIELSPEVRDTFFVYSPGWRILNRAEYLAVPPDVRRALAKTRDRSLGAVRWPEDMVSGDDRAMIRYIEDGVSASRHRDVSESTWASAEQQLPEARRLAGTFASRSGPNCFGTVMGAAGVTGAEDEWMFQEPFEKWLAEVCAPTSRGHDGEPGVVLVWRDRDGLAVHAAVTLGEGWALNKPSQAWCSPRFVWPVKTTVLHSRRPGASVFRYRLTHPY